MERSIQNRKKQGPTSNITLSTKAIIWNRDGKHKAHGPNTALHLVLSGLVPFFYPAAAPSSRLTVKEWLHLYIYTFIVLKLHSAL